MMGVIILLFGLSNMGQFQLEIPEFLPAQSNVICEEMHETRSAPNCNQTHYSKFRSWC